MLLAISMVPVAMFGEVPCVAVPLIASITPSRLRWGYRERISAACPATKGAANEVTDQ